MMMDTKLTMLLQIIQNNGNVGRLIREGVSFRDITKLTTSSIEAGYLTYENERVSLTDKGAAYLKETLESIKRINKEEWIEKDKKSQVAKIDKNAIFVPGQNELTFLIHSLK